MSGPDLALLVFGDTAPVVSILPAGQASECVVVHGMPANARGWTSQGEPLILLALGAEGGAALARWVDAHGLDGVAGVGLVGVTAPWAEREPLLHGPCFLQDCDHIIEERLPLGPVEPLRAVAERARRCAPLCPSCRSERVRPDTDDCKHFICACGHAFTPTPLRIVIACAPDDGVCRTCNGDGFVYGDAFCEGGSPENCSECGGTGKALSSADVALELSGERALYDGIDDFQATTGGLTVIHYPPRPDLDKHGIAAVVGRLLG